MNSRLEMGRLPLRGLLMVAGIVIVVAMGRCGERPNFVWLISEDNSKHFLSLYDEMGTDTPRIAALAEEGLIFEHAFSNAPVCSVARTTLMTGCYAPRIGTQFHRKAVTVPLPQGVKMFPTWLREAGYYATNNRKKDYNAIENEGVWDESSPRASWRNRKPGQPFFHMQSFGVSHESSLHFSRTVFENEATDTDPDSVQLAPYHPDTKLFRYTYARYHDRIRQVDRQIGSVVDQMKAEGLLENTFIFYFGDHGGVLPGTKGYGKERGLHVPLVIRVPENFRHLIPLKIGSRVNGFVQFIDFGPTLLHLAGLKVPLALDGDPFLGPDLNEVTLSRRDEAFGYADRFDEKYDFVRVLRKGRYSYVRSYQPFNFDGLQNNYRYIMLAYEEWRQRYEAGALTPVQRQFFEPQPVEALYDVERDPHEIENLARYPESSAVLLEMRERLNQRVVAMNDLSFFPESDLAQRAFGNPTEFGQSQHELIARLVKTADLSLKPYAEAQREIGVALESEEWLVRYWGLIVCSSHGTRAVPMAQRARKLAARDANRLVRMRAAEFLGLIGVEDPRPVMLEVLRSTTSGIEACLMLNTVVLLQDGSPGYRFELGESDLQEGVAKDLNVQRRMRYLVGDLRRP